MLGTLKLCSNHTWSKDPDDYLKMPKKNSSKSFIVQEYIHNPFLIDGLKFDLRIYVVIVSLKPLEIYICDEGLVRFATVNYQIPNEENKTSDDCKYIFEMKKMKQE